MGKRWAWFTIDKQLGLDIEVSDRCKSDLELMLKKQSYSEVEEYILAYIGLTTCAEQDELLDLTDANYILTNGQYDWQWGMYMIRSYIDDLVRYGKVHISFSRFHMSDETIRTWDELAKATFSDIGGALDDDTNPADWIAKPPEVTE